LKQVGEEVPLKQQVKWVPNFLKARRLSNTLSSIEEDHRNNSVDISSSKEIGFNLEPKDNDNKREEEEEEGNGNDIDETNDVSLLETIAEVIVEANDEESQRLRASLDIQRVYRGYCIRKNFKKIKEALHRKQQQNQLEHKNIPLRDAVHTDILKKPIFSKDIKKSEGFQEDLGTNDDPRGTKVVVVVQAYNSNNDLSGDKMMLSKEREDPLKWDRSSRHTHLGLVFREANSTSTKRNPNSETVQHNSSSSSQSSSSSSSVATSPSNNDPNSGLLRKPDCYAKRLEELNKEKLKRLRKKVWNMFSIENFEETSSS